MSSDAASAMFRRPGSDLDSPLHSRSVSSVSRLSSLCDSPLGLSSYSSWTTGSLHSRQSSLASCTSPGPHHHQRHGSRDSGHPETHDNRGYERSPASSRHKRLAPGLHSRQTSYDTVPAPWSPADPGLGVPASLRPASHLPKYSPVCQDQGYHTMVGPASSPDISPSASIDLSALSLSCPRGVTRPRPPDVPDISLDTRNFVASYRPGHRPGLASLPDDLLLRVLGQCDAVTRARLGRASRRLHRLAWQPGLWTSVRLTGDSHGSHGDTDSALASVLTCIARADPGHVASHVTRVSLAFCSRLSDSGLSSVSRLCPALTRLELTSCKLVTNTGLADVVTRCPRLQHLDITGCSLVSGLEPSSRGELRERLSRGLSLTHLDLTDCQRLDDLSLRLILQASSGMENLYLRRCSNITDTGIKMVSAHCFMLRELSISDCPRVTDASLLELARLGPRLRYLSAAKCGLVTDRGVTAVARHCYKLRYLNLRGCEAVSDAALEMIARSCSRLRSLDIGKCDVTDAGLQALASRLPGLRKLSLRGCEMITDAGVEAVASHCRGLAQLNIQECEVSLETYRAVKRCCSKCIIEHSNPGFH